MDEWNQVRQEGLPELSWWDMIVKPGIRRIAMERSKQINDSRRSQLNILLLRQAYLVRKIQNFQWDNLLAELFEIQLNIQTWYQSLSEKIQHQSRVDEYQVSEQTRIYHHELHRKHLKKCSILKLITNEGTIEGHDLCAKYLENTVGNLLLEPAELNENAQETLLSEVDTVITDANNEMLAAVPTKKEVYNKWHSKPGKY